MDRQSFAHRSETFGYPDAPWATDTLRLLYNVPRAYEPLVRAWEGHYPHSRRALARLVKMGFVTYQGPVIMDTLSGDLAERATRSVHRYRTTSKGRRLLVAADEDIRILEDAFPRTSARNLSGVAALLANLDLDGSHARFGLSQAHAVALSGLADRSGRWWIARLVEAGYLRELPERYADIREVVPAHWRVTRALSNQFSDVLQAFDGPGALKVELRLERNRYLEDIDPARLGISGATDFDHDVEAQRVLSAVLNSSRCVAEGRIMVEPRHHLPVFKSHVPWRFDVNGPSSVFYQPDAEVRERTLDGRLRRCVVEYERFQSRRDGWNHIQRFLGYLHTKVLPFEPAVLRFVVDTPQRVASYRELIEAFCDWALDHPDAMPRNEVTLAVSSVPEVLGASDALDAHHWYLINLPSPTKDPVVTIHAKTSSPYDEYFSR